MVSTFSPTFAPVAKVAGPDTARVEATPAAASTAKRTVPVEATDRLDSLSGVAAARLSAPVFTVTPSCEPV